MTFEEWKKALFERADREGFSEYEIYYVNTSRIGIGVFEGELDKYSVSESQGISFRGKYAGKMGYAYSEILDEASIDLLVAGAKENAFLLENDEDEVIYGERQPYPEFSGYEESLAQVTPTEKISLAKELEKAAKSQNDRVIRAETSVSDGESLCRIVNSKGLDLSFRSNSLYAAVRTVVRDEENMRNNYSFISTRNYADVHVEELAEEAVRKALEQTGAESVPSGRYRIALKNEIAAQILQTFSVIFQADQVQKGLSLLKDKVGSAIGSKAVTIIDDPLLKEGMASRPFDDEGVASYTKDVLRNGELRSLLYNLKTAAKDGVQTTGNASKGGYSSPVEVSPSNFYVQPGDKDLEGILETLGSGLLITEVQGLHSGANPVSGDFSLAAKGFLIENGKKQKPVEQITIAGNFYRLLENVEEVGSDLKFGSPTGHGAFGSPTLLVKELSVAGK